MLLRLRRNRVADILPVCLQGNHAELMKDHPGWPYVLTGWSSFCKMINVKVVSNRWLKERQL